MPRIQLDNGLHIHYEQAGQGEALILLHGLGSSSRDWEYQQAEFARHFHVIVPDLRGFGRSDKPAGPYRVADFASDCWNLLTLLGIEKAHVVGLSMGGATAFEMAASQPGRCRRLVVTNCPPGFELGSARQWFEFGMRIVVVRLLGMKRMAHIVADKLFPEARQADLKQTFIERYSANEKKHYLWALRSLAGWSVVDRLQNINCPALMVAAEHDYSPVEDKQVAVDRLPQGELAVISGSRHATPIDSPEPYNATVLEFLRR